MTVIRRHCAGNKITKNIILDNPTNRGDNGIYQYSNNMISQKSNSNVISDLNEWSQSWAMRRKRKMIKYNNEHL